MSPSADAQLRKLLDYQPPYLTLVGWLLPILMAVLVGFVIYQIWKLLREEP
jgi:hypothetical protein